MSSNRGVEMDKYLTMYSDFISNSILFVGKNIDKVLMSAIIVFLIMAWTIIFEWDFPDKKNIILQKTIAIDSYTVKTNKKGEVEGKPLRENMQNINDLLEKELILDCGDDNICKQNQSCLSKTDSFECSSLKNCCLVNSGGKKRCVGGSKEGPTYNINKVDEWWYLGNHYKKN